MTRACFRERRDRDAVRLVKEIYVEERKTGKEVIGSDTNRADVNVED